MQPFKVLQVFTLLLFSTQGTFAQTWCGKNYKKTSSPSPPGGEFPIPAKSSTSLLALRCTQAIRPYLPGDINSSADPNAVSILIDTPVTFSKISNAAQITIPTGTSPFLQVTVTIDSKTLASGSVPLNATKHALPFALTSLTPRKQPYTISCKATLNTQTFSATGSLTYLPNPPSTIGSVTKIDGRTGALLAKPANGKGGNYAPVLPIGFYTSFDGYLDKDFTIPAKLASQGFTVIHPNPPLTNLTALEIVLDKMQEAGLYLMYDMRWTYQDSAAVTAEVNRIKSRPNLLLWYTADEPDGTSDPLDATSKSSKLITSLDGGDGAGGAGYHPVSLVLNCQNYHFNEYSAGADILLQDTYMIGNNVTFSTVWGTPCTTDYGDCGCDNCEGKFEDISNRMDQFAERLHINGQDRTKAVWTVPQGFGEETYWKRYPTGKEFVVQSVLGINHGGLGVVSWDDPTSADIKDFGSILAKSLPKMIPFITNPTSTYTHFTINRVDIALWTLGKQILVLGTNMNNDNVLINLKDLGLPATGSSSAFTQVLNSEASLDGARNRFSFTGTGTGAWIVSV